MDQHKPPVSAPSPSGPPSKPSDSAQSVIPATPWQRARAGRRARQSEEQGAKISQGRRVSGSGNGRVKGDIQTAKWRIENKLTDANSFTVTKDLLDKITHEALHTPPGLLPQMRIQMPGYTLRVLREQDYLYLEAMAAKHMEG